jgi:hypothetical protein
MWSSFLDKGKELAEKAKRAAEALDKQLDETVGIQTATTPTTATTTRSSTLLLPSFSSSLAPAAPVVADDDDALQWNDDEEEDNNNDDDDDKKPSSAIVMKKDVEGWGTADENEEDLELDSEEEEPKIVQPHQGDSHVLTQPQPKEEIVELNALLEIVQDKTMLEFSTEQPPPLAAVGTEEPTTTELESGPFIGKKSSVHDSIETEHHATTTEQTSSSYSSFWGVSSSVGSAFLLGETKPQTQPSHHTEEMMNVEIPTSSMMVVDAHTTALQQPPPQDTEQPPPEAMPPPETVPPRREEANTSPRTTTTTTIQENVFMPEQETSSLPLTMIQETEPTQTGASWNWVVDAESTDASKTAEDVTVPLPLTTHPYTDDANDQQQQQQQQPAEETRFWEQKVLELQNQLAHREEQLFSKTEQMTMMESMFETEKHDLLQKIQNTKDEAKRRIQKAKERVEAMELRLQDVTASQHAGAEDAQKQAEIVAALREEGEKLARRQMDMEAAVRAAKGETRELREQLEEMETSKVKAEEKIVKLEADWKATKEDLASARRGESQADKLDAELRSVREESEKRAAIILSLELEAKELKASQKELRKELEETQKGAAVESMQEIKKLKKEHGELVSDLETKIRTMEREAAVREDSLRHEVDELRKRWQDAVRRADALSVDVQSSTAPLLRQLESTNKQHRARATAWAELETQLRAELEENVIQNEKLSRERSEWKTKCSRLERMNTEYESELKQLKSELHIKTSRIETLEQKITEMEVDGAKMKEEWAEVERLANEGVSRVRSEMSKTVVEAEERHRMQLDSLETQLKLEREQRTQLEKQVEGLLEKVGMFVPETVTAVPVQAVFNETKPKTLRQSESQIEILSGAVGGFGSGEDTSDDEDEDINGAPVAGGASSFAALEQLTSRLKAAKVELATLRDRLSESERTREELVQDLAESRNAREKLPLFEAKVKELSSENEELRQEVEGLREDIMDVKNMYRTQLNVLLEEKAAWNGKSNESAPKSTEDVQIPDDNNNATDETLIQSA